MFLSAHGKEEAMAESSSNSGKGKNMVFEGNKKTVEKEIVFNDELQLEFIVNVGIVKDS